MSPAIITLCVLAVVAILFITEIIPLAISSLSGAIALGLLGVIPEKQIFAGLSNSTVVLFAGMFVIGAALFHTGMAQEIGAKVVKMCGSSETKLMFGVMLVTIIMSSVLSNTGTAASLIPVVTGICAVAKLKGSRFLMPMAIAANVGGTITMVGTPPNIIVTGAIGIRKREPLSLATAQIPVTAHLSDTAQNAMMNTVTIFLALGTGCTMSAESFLNIQTLEIIGLGLVAFIFGTAGGVVFGQLMYMVDGKTNPLIGSAGVSAVPMAARVSQIVGSKANPANFLLMHAMGPNVAGVIGTAVAAGTMLAMLGAHG